MEKVDARPGNSTTSSAASEQSCVLTTIRRNVLQSCSLRLASEEVPKAKSLRAFSKQNRFPNRKFGCKVLPKVVELCRKNQKDFDLTSSVLVAKAGISPCWSCQHCPLVGMDSRSKGKLRSGGEGSGFQDEEESDEGEGVPGGSSEKKKRVVFIDEQLAAFNVNR